MSKLVIHNKASDGTYYSNIIHLLDGSRGNTNYFNKITCEPLATSPIEKVAYKFNAENNVNIIFKNEDYSGTKYIIKSRYDVILSNLVDCKDIRSVNEIPTLPDEPVNPHGTHQLVIVKPKNNISFTSEGIHYGTANVSPTVQIFGNSNSGYVNNTMYKEESYLVLMEVAENNPSWYYFFSTCPRS